MTALLKTTYKIRAALLTLGTGLMICSSCTDEDFVKAPQNGDRMSFGVSISDQWTAGHSTRSAEPQQPKYEAYQFDNSDMWIVASAEANFTGGCFAEIQPSTRATEGNSNNFETLYKSFGVYAYVRSHSETDWNQSEASVYINDDEPVKNGSIWENSPVRYWPGAGYDMRFFAYAPKNLDFKDKTGSKNELELEYRVAQKAENQQDILATELTAAAGDRNSTLDLHFKHLLTAVKVKLKEGDLKDFGTVSKVSISGVQGHGLYDATTATWQKDYDTKTMEFTSEPTVGGDDEANIVYGEFTFMMLPQVLTENAKIKIEFSDGKQALEGTIGGGDKTDWEKSAKVIYTISKTGEITEFYIAEENGKPISEFQFDNNGGNRSFKVYSFNNDSGIPWEIERVEGSVDMLGYDKWWENTHWQQLWKGDGSRSGEQRNCNVITLPDGFMSVSSELDIPTDVNGQYWDLSLPTPKDINNPKQDHNISQRTTANCYIVNCQNDFIFPAIYGNAIKNGQINESAYKDKNFVDYSGNIITSPYMDDKIDKVEVEWQDVSHFIEYVEIASWQNLKNQIDVGNTGPIQEDDKRKYIKCHWRAESQQDFGGIPIRQGNAVVSAFDNNGNKIWSWHLWISNIGGQTLTRGNYQFLPYNLGWTGGVVNGFREATIHFIQEGTGKTCSLKLKQGNKNGLGLSASNLHYQWGRKDPFECDDRDLYKPENRNRVETPFSYTNGTGAVNLSTKIDPVCFYPAGTGNWWIGNISNLWCSDIKTIYDPCPRGFMVPTQEALRQIMGELPEAGMRTNQNIYSPDGSFYWGADYNDGLPDYIGSEKGKYNPAYGFSIRPMREPE